MLVKTDDVSREIIQDAVGMFRCAELFGDDIAKASGVDEQRMRSYEVMMTSSFMMKGVDASLCVAWVQEEDLRSGEQEEFWVVASAEYLTVALTAQEMRELARISTASSRVSHSNHLSSLTLFDGHYSIA